MYKRLKDNQIQTPIKGLAGLKFSYQRKKREMLSNPYKLRWDNTFGLHSNENF